MVTEMEMTVWIRLVQGSEKVKDQDVDDANIFVYLKNLTERNFSYIAQNSALKSILCKHNS